MKISVIANIINSRRDIYGNCYYAMTVTNTLTGASAHGTISGGESNCTYAIRKLVEFYFPETEYQYYTKELPIREYNRLVKDWQYIGCTPEEINKNILNQWKVQ